MNQILTKQLLHLSWSCKVFSEKTSIAKGLECVANPKFLTLIQPKINALKVLYFPPPCINEYAKKKEMEEKEKNTTIFANIGVTND